MFSSISRAILLATLGFPPKVSIDTSLLRTDDAASPADERLHGWLLLRLLEEGYAIAPSLPLADIRLRVRSVEDGVSVEAEGARSAAYHLERGASGLVLLEVLQRAVLALDGAGPKAKGIPQAAASVAIEVAEGSQQELNPRVREQLAAELTRAGFVLVPARAPRDAVVCLGLRDEQITMGIGSSSKDCVANAVALASRDLPVDELTPLVAARSRTLAFETSTSARVDAGLGAPAPPASSVPVPALAEPESASAGAKPSSNRLSFPFGVTGGAWLRAGGPDPLFLVHVDAFARSEFGLRLQSGLSWSSAEPSLSIFEIPLQVGVVWRRAVDSSFGVSAAFLGGALVHHYDYDAHDRGTRLNFIVSFVPELWLRTAPLQVSFALSPSVSGPARDHEIVGGAGWQRGAVSLALLVGVGVGP